MRKACARGIKDIFDCAPFDPESSDGSNPQPTEFLSLLQDPDDPWVRSYVPPRLKSHTLFRRCSPFMRAHIHDKELFWWLKRETSFGVGGLAPRSTH